MRVVAGLILRNPEDGTEAGLCRDVRDVPSLDRPAVLRRDRNRLTRLHVVDVAERRSDLGVARPVDVDREDDLRGRRQVSGARGRELHDELVEAERRQVGDDEPRVDPGGCRRLDARRRDAQQHVGELDLGRPGQGPGAADVDVDRAGDRRVLQARQSHRVVHVPATVDDGRNLRQVARSNGPEDPARGLRDGHADARRRRQLGQRGRERIGDGLDSGLSRGGRRRRGARADCKRLDAQRARGRRVERDGRLRGSLCADSGLR